MRSRTRKRIGKNPAFLAFVRRLPCIICCPCNVLDDYQWNTWSLRAAALAKQKSPTEVAHVGDRAYSTKCGDIEAIPLCAPFYDASARLMLGHHREGPESAHVLQRRFFAHHGLDRDELIAALQWRFQQAEENL